MLHLWAMTCASLGALCWHMQAPHSFSGYKPSKSTAGAAATTSTITFGSKSDLLSSSSGSMGGGNVDADPTGPLVQVRQPAHTGNGFVQTNVLQPIVDFKRPT